MYQLSLERKESLDDHVRRRTEPRFAVARSMSNRDLRVATIADANSETERWRLIRELKESTLNGRKAYDDVEEDEDDAGTAPSLRSTKSWWSRKPSKIDDNRSSATSKTKGLRSRLSRWSRRKSSKSRNKTEHGVDESFESYTVHSAPDLTRPNLAATRSTFSLRNLMVGQVTKSFDDDEITLGSAFGTNDTDYQKLDYEPAPAPPTKLHRRASFFSRLFQRRKKAKPSDMTSEESQPTDDRISDSDSESSSSFDEEIMASSSSSFSFEGDDVLGEATSGQATLSTSPRRTISPMDRWSPISVEVTPDAPKQPMRRTDGDSNGASLPPPPIQEEMKDHVDESEDDESVVSLLSGLLATWAAQREEEERDDFEASPKAGRKSCLKSPQRSTRPVLSVAFGRVLVREYARCVGDNPSCSSGPPISLDWAYLEAQAYNLDEYESDKPDKRSKKEFYLPAVKRKDILSVEWQCSEEEMRKARREATYVQYCREKSAFTGSRAAAKEAAFLRKANRKLVKAKVDVSDTSQPVVSRSGSPTKQLVDVAPIRPKVPVSPTKIPPSPNQRKARLQTPEQPYSPVRLPPAAHTPSPSPARCEPHRPTPLFRRVPSGSSIIRVTPKLQSHRSDVAAPRPSHTNRRISSDF